MSTFDIAQFRARVDGDEELVQQIIAIVRENSQKLLAEIRSGIEAKDMTKIATSAHSLKSSVGNLGDEHAAHAAQRIEAMGWDGVLDGMEDAYQALTTAIGQLEEALRVHIAPATSNPAGQ